MTRASLVAFVLLLASPFFAIAQEAYPRPLAQLQEFLELSDSQVEAILRNNDEINQWIAEKEARASRVVAEMAAETVKDAPEPLALGVRYVELELLCRELSSKTAEFRKKNAATLSDPQRLKLKVLEEAIRLAPVINEAQTGNLLDSRGYFPRTYSGSNGGGEVIFAILTPGDGCYFRPIPLLPLAPQPAALARPLSRPLSKRIQ